MLTLHWITTCHVARCSYKGSWEMKSIEEVIIVRKKKPLCLPQEVLSRISFVIFTSSKTQENQFFELHFFSS
ncbi:mCG147894 [Mus musculus]|nr:mCG147894 [Mus musculus]